MPNIQNGNRLIVNKVDYKFTNPHRFDLVVFHATPKEDYIKRVIGLPGENVVYRNDMLYINGKPVAEPYLKAYKAKTAGGHLTGDFTLEDITGQSVIPAGKVLVLGDNRMHSVDSRLIGLVNIKDIVGKVSLRYWPIDKMSNIPGLEKK